MLFKHISDAMEVVKYLTIHQVLLWKKSFWFIVSAAHLTSQQSKLLKEKLLLYQTNGMIPIYIKLPCFFFQSLKVYLFCHLTVLKKYLYTVLVKVA